MATSGRSTKGDWRSVSAWLLVLALTAGCRTLSKQGPVSQSTATCRQLTQQGINAMDRGDWKRAESLLARAVQTSESDSDARRSYGEALWHRGARRDALSQMEQARTLTGEDPGLEVRTGELYLALGQVNDASRLAERALELDPRFAPAWTLRGKVATAVGQHRRALADYQRALGFAPGDRDINVLVAETYRYLNEPQRALLALQTVADCYLAGEEPQQILYLEGLALLALSRHDEAAQTLLQASHRERPTPLVLCALAEAEWHNGQPARAQHAVEQALALEPGNAESQALSARINRAMASAGALRR